MQGTLVSDDACLEHDTGPGHPESAQRIRAVLRRLDARPDLLSILERRSSPPVPESALLAVHTPGYVDALREAAARGDSPDPETPMTEHSFRAALAAAGAGLVGIDAVERTGRFAFCLVRPPGHHAHAARAGAFCLLNNVAVAAESLRRRGNRVFVLDWDAHHGDGTQELFYESPDVFYLSIHEDLPYPGTGAVTEVGRGPGMGANLNIPFPSGTGEASWLRAFDEVVVPVAHAFAPDWILVSAGYNAHLKDPLAHQRPRTRTFAFLSGRVRDLAGALCSGRLVLFLEGGYDLAALADSVEVSLWELAGEHAFITDTRPKPDASPDAARSVDVALARVREHWDV